MTASLPPRVLDTVPAALPAASIALITHDLKNALGALEAELAALRDEPRADRAAEAHRHCADLRRKLMHFLTLYCSDTGLRAHCEDESPQDLLQHLLKSARRTARVQAAHCALHAGVAADAPPFWYLDRRLVGLAIEAAVHNALRFARGQVTLDVRVDEDWLVLSVDDDGPGLGASDPSEHSTGLGTALCRAVADAHQHAGRQGRVRLFDRPGGGARFELWLP